nr:uncharacterized protein LOC111987051 [Quercus suber]
MASENFSYYKLKQESWLIDEESKDERSLRKKRRWSKITRSLGRRRPKVRIPGLRRFLRKKKRPESTVIEEIIQWINYELDREVLSVSEHLVGMESRVEEMLDLCLGERSLITIDEYGTLWMHDLLQEMGQDIVRRESLKELGRRSRLWRYEDVLHVLENNIGTKFVEGIVLKTPRIKD